VCRNFGVKRTTLIETLARIGWSGTQGTTQAMERFPPYSGLTCVLWRLPRTVTEAARLFRERGESAVGLDALIFGDRPRADNTRAFSCVQRYVSALAAAAELQREPGLARSG